MQHACSLRRHAPHDSAQIRFEVVADRRAENGTTKYPESLCLILALPRSGRREPPPARTLLLGHGSYRLIRQSRSALHSFGLSLVRGVSAGCDQPLPRRFRGVPVPVSSSTSAAFPSSLSRSASRLYPSKRFHDASLFRDCSHFFMFRPSGLLASQTVPTAATHRKVFLFRFDPVAGVLGGDLGTWV